MSNDPPTVHKALYRVNEVGELLSLGRTTVYELIRSGRLTGAKVGRSTRVTGESVRRFLEALESEAA